MKFLCFTSTSKRRNLNGEGFWYSKDEHFNGLEIEKDFQLFISRAISINVHTSSWLLFSTIQWNGEKKGWESKQTKSFLWFWTLFPVPRKESTEIFADLLLIRLFPLAAIHCPPSHEFFFYFQLRWVIMEGLSQNTDNKLHICDNHLGEKRVGLGKSLNGNARDSMDNVLGWMDWWMWKGILVAAFRWN